MRSYGGRRGFIRPTESTSRLAPVRLPHYRVADTIRGSKNRQIDLSQFVSEDRVPLARETKQQLIQGFAIREVTPVRRKSRSRS